jgi:diguanylate cyclase (GGDEF)-like protein/PAS domain S-box-containing protein
VKVKNNNVLNILIAEDSRTQAEQLAFLLEQHGYQVSMAADGKQALQAAHVQKPALIISDIMMPGMNGYELCKAIKSTEKLKDIPVILVTTLSDAQDVIRGLECGADNFIRKPYDEDYLLSRIGYLLMNGELRKNQKMQMGVEIDLAGHKHFITAERQQILDLLISTYEQAVHINDELKLRETDLERSNQVLNGLYRIAEGLNQVVSQKAVAETALEKALELPEVQAGWIFLREDEAGFRLAAARNLPAVLTDDGVMDGVCDCQRRLLAGELDSVTNILECERLKAARGDTGGLRYHASVPLWAGDRMMGIMNLVGADQGLFGEAELKILYGIGNQVAVALERARLHEQLELLVEERTAALRASEARLLAIIEAEPECVKIVDDAGRVVQINAAGLAMFEADHFEQIQGRNVVDFVVDAQRDDYLAFETSVLGGNNVAFAFEIVGLKGAHRWLDTHAVLLPMSQPGRPQILAITRDITLRKANEAKIKRLNRIYSVLSGINTTIVRVGDEEELFREACRIAVEYGKFSFAWIGKLDADSRQVIPVARAGHDNGYLATLDLTAGSDVSTLISQTLDGMKPMICNDIASDTRMSVWSREALSRGYLSATAFPLVLEEQPVGVFVLYAPETNVFDDEEIKLLTEMAGDISFALDHLNKAARLDYLAYFDAITGLPNRSLFYDRLGQLMHEVRDGETLAVLAIDLERFSDINETFGRRSGDALLKEVAMRLKETDVGGDHLARINADCFAMILPDIRVEADVVRFLEGPVAAVIGKPFRLDGQELRVSVRAGIAIFPDNGNDADTLFRNAEAALKKAKLSGNRYLFYTPEFNARVAEKLTLENKLRRALEQEQLVLHYQPKVDLKSNQIVGLEALMRWNDPEAGLVPPSRFIPLLEETGMIIEAGSWALTQAMKDYRAWHKQGLAPSRIAVNVSQVQLQRSDFVSTIERMVNSSGGVAEGLEIEITESLIMLDVEANIRKLHAIREMGVEVAVDDFGTGYSSLSYIAKLPINVLKIDISFIVNMTHNANDLSIVSAIISLAHSLNLRVVAEGVETLEQANLLRLLKCDEIQGFLFSPGVVADQITGFLRDKKTLQ